MRRRRQVLQVSTFPFLAVLLCAMGSLILLLLVLDRRAKVVAVSKAQAAAARIRTAAQEAAEARAGERAQLRADLIQAYEQRKQELHGQVQSLGRQLATVTQGSREEVARFQALQRRLQEASAQNQQAESELATKRNAVSQIVDPSDATQRERARLTAELQQMEVTMLQLQAARLRAQLSYSVIPYKGKQSSNRRPIYVECEEAGLIFHPDRKKINLLHIAVAEVRAEVERRQAELYQPVSQTPVGKVKPYLLLLVRPDGIMNYYRLLGVLRDLEIEFGYEFLEPGWQLDFPANEAAPADQPWQTVAAQPTPAQGGRPTVGKPMPVGVPGQATHAMSGDVSPDRGSSGVASETSSASTGVLSLEPPGRGSVPATQAATVKRTLAGTGTIPGTQSSPEGATSLLKLGSESPGGSIPRELISSGTIAQGPLAAATSSPGRRSSEFASLVPREGSAKSGFANSTKTNSGEPGTGGGAEAGTQMGGNLSAKPQAGGDEPAGDPLARLAGRTPGAKPVRAVPVPLSRLNASRDWVLTVECRADYVLFQATGQRIPVAGLLRGADGGNPLLDSLQKVVERRQATVRPGELPYRPQVRFLVHADGLRTYYAAYPALEFLQIPMTRENFAPEDEAKAPAKP